MRSKEATAKETLPRAKGAAGETSSAEDRPVFVRAVGVRIGPNDRDYVRRKLGRKLGKFSRHVERSSVRIEDVNGPRGGIDKLCRIKVVLHGLPSVVVEESHEQLQAALDGALARVTLAVRQATDSRRSKGTRRGK
jgi:ribosome-associated translation inhibitor RaiA